MVMVLNMLVLGLLSLFAAFVNNFDIVVEDGGNNGNHVSLYDSGPHILCASNADIDDALKSKIPLPCAHHILAPALLENADESLDASIDGEDITDASGRGCEIGEVVERVYEWQCRGAIQGPAIVEGGGNAH